jgi:hypothetical protein
VAYSHKVGDTMLSSIAVQGSLQQGGKLVAMGDVQGTVSLLEVCESLAASQSSERKAIDLMFEREMKQEKNLEAREREIKRQRAAEAESRNRDAQDKKDAKDEKMEALLRKVDADFLRFVFLRAFLRPLLRVVNSLRHLSLTLSTPSSTFPTHSMIKEAEEEEQKGDSLAEVDGDV